MRETRIRPRSGWQWIDLRELWQARDLVGLLVRRDLVTKYAQTLLGPLWFAVQPLGLAIVLSVAINGGAGIGTEGVPPFLFNLCSLAPWLYFSQTFGAVGATFVNNADLFQKVYFPRSAVPLAIGLSNLVSLAIQTGLFLAVLIFYHFDGIWMSLSWRLLLIPVLFTELVVFTLGAGLCVAALAAQYRDLVHATQYVLLIAMFASLVFVPMSNLPPHLQLLPWFNPLAVIIESMRSLALNTAGVTPVQSIVSVLTSASLFLLGLVAFERASRTAVDLA
ncbi:ABC transporter permease [Mesorhizobium sp. B1-1-8]|uniref:ABC transporter permease n=1 Tax=Mesorhizobium sp. B1-1-8 TaxID=2589976 RepID=UPI001129D5DC|nr:ABC transporter permease [Mesorhizobium sp. B1-1-8]UCI10745.1 ABC transporter permease [Mesorhizobium sp. B1-1-8]